MRRILKLQSREKVRRVEGRNTRSVNDMHFSLSPTKHMIILEPQNPLVAVFHLWKRRLYARVLVQSGPNQPNYSNYARTNAIENWVIPSPKVVWSLSSQGRLRRHCRRRKFVVYVGEHKNRLKPRTHAIKKSARINKFDSKMALNQLFCFEFEGFGIFFLTPRVILFLYSSSLGPLWSR